jgi:hypothetical protein
MFDIVILHGPNDDNIINKNIEYNSKNIIGYNKIYIISHDKNLKIDNCITINEEIFPFKKSDMEIYIKCKQRCGWYLQQLLKLYSHIYIKELLDHYLVIDSDTLFLKKTEFFENNIPLYNFGNEYHLDYFDHMKRFLPELSKQNNTSGICHHMIFNKTILKELFLKVETLHKDIFWKVFLNCVNNKCKNSLNIHAGVSEYEIYYNYIIKYHKDKMKIRELKRADVSSIPTNSCYDYLSLHHYMRR